MPIFYRYIRPLELDEQRIELRTAARGGVCLRFEGAGGHGDLRFTHARCHADELFSKTVAKQIADQRALQYIGVQLPTVPYSMDSATLADSVVAACEWDPAHGNGDVSPFQLNYLKLELHELKNALQLLLVSNRRELEKHEIWMAGIEAAQHGRLYESLGR